MMAGKKMGGEMAEKDFDNAPQVKGAM